MYKIVSRSVIISLFIALISYLARDAFNTPGLMSDLGGISVFASIFGTLFGILTAFIVVEVWNQYNKTAQLIDDEANGLEKLFRLSLFFRDAKFASEIKDSILDYMKNVIADSFKTVAKGERNQDGGKLFRKISVVLNNVRFDDDHDNVVFSQMISTYDDLSTTRTLRISQSLARLPQLLKFFLYVCIFIAVGTLVFLPFQSIILGVFAVSCLTFMLVMVLLVIEDLDNPFVGAWNLDTEAYKRVMTHIEEDYTK